MKKLVLTFIAIALVGYAASAMGGSPAAITVKSDPPKPSHLIVYYFHGDFRCSSCIKIEQYTIESIENNFKDKIESGQIVLKVINVDAKGNDHYEKDYQLYTKSVIVSLIKNNKQVKWKNLAKVWDNLNNKPAFMNYIKDEVSQYLKEL